MPHQLLARGFVGLHMCCPIFLCFSQFFSLQEFARYILYVCLISILKPCREEVKRWGMELKAKGVLVHGNIDNRCLRVEHHQDSHANARPVMLELNLSLFLFICQSSLEVRILMMLHRQ
ncbi:hypothetical protein Peur_074530 [Populus x canadensis]